MVMCHMVADTHRELLAMATEIGVKHKWLQEHGDYREHFDICRSKRALAVAAGALEVTTSDVARMLRTRRHAGAAAFDEYYEVRTARL